MSLSQLEQSIGHGRRAHGSVAEAREHGGEIEAPVSWRSASRSSMVCMSLCLMRQVLQAVL
jgi:hypothetical protein